MYGLLSLQLTDLLAHTLQLRRAKLFIQLLNPFDMAFHWHSDLSTMEVWL